ncbi:MAG TPA: type II toxin-antitoxin system RelE/ParE family toxin [Devosiaceae bacterium]|nr:type II toxin-antitoxin system RelE/ParE family toxin [Devosiaceae bacterium]
MKRRVFIQPQAQEDLRSIVSYVASQSVPSAVKVGALLEHAIGDLGVGALQYALLNRYRAAGIRRRVVGAYNVYFRVTDDRVDVLRIVHSARDVARLLPEADES